MINMSVIFKYLLCTCNEVKGNIYKVIVLICDHKGVGVGSA